MTFESDWAAIIPRLEADLRLREQSAGQVVSDEAAWQLTEHTLRAHGQVLLRTYPVFREEDVEDIVQELLIKLQSLETMRRVRAAGSPAGYIAVTMRNAAFDLLRRRQRESEVFRSFAEEALLRSRREAVNPEADRSSALRQSLRRLGHAERDLLKMRFWRNMSIRGIADELGISYSAAAVRLFRVLRRMRETMGSEAK
ncbi:MAG TPA: sigma-70 family RNA polymerase sigma factor [Acidobacteriota bacterium]|jgi:RNA polymerase sigma-70 factor (ECF subfamily)